MSGNNVFPCPGYTSLLSVSDGCLHYIVWIVSATLAKKPFRLDSIDVCSLVYGNVGNLMLPLVNMMFGSEYVFYVSSLQIPFNLFVWTHGQTAISAHQGIKQSINIKKILLNPNMIALITGLIFCALQIRIPTVIDTAMEGLSGMVGPCSMLVVGMVIAGHDLKSVFTTKKAYLISFGRLVIMPSIALLIYLISGIFDRSPEMLPVLSVLFIAFCAPPAATVSQLAVLYDNKPYEASIYNVLSMIACVFTMPLMLSIFQLVFGSAA